MHHPVVGVKAEVMLSWSVCGTAKSCSGHAVAPLRDTRNTSRPSPKQCKHLSLHQVLLAQKLQTIGLSCFAQGRLCTAHRPTVRPMHARPSSAPAATQGVRHNMSRPTQSDHVRQVMVGATDAHSLQHVRNYHSNTAEPLWKGWGRCWLA